MLASKKGIPELSFHAVDLRETFTNLGEVLAAFAAGAPDRDGRERDAILAAIVKAFLTQHIEIADLQDIPGDRHSCSRLLYACLLAQAFNWDADADLYLRQMYEQLEKRMEAHVDNEGLTDLFTGIPARHAKRTMFEESARIRQGACVADIRKMI